MIIKRIILIMLALALLMAALGSCAKKDTAQTSDLGVSRSNSVQSDGWVYYNTADGLFKIRPNGEGKSKILDNPTLMFSINNNRIYYVPHEVDSRKMIPIDEEQLEYISFYSCSTDGSDNEFIYETQFNYYEMSRLQMRVVDGWIYLGLMHKGRDMNYTE